MPQLAVMAMSWALAAAPQAPPALQQRHLGVLDFEPSEFRIEDLGGKPGAELLFIGINGEVRTWNLQHEGWLGSWVLPVPSRTLLTLSKEAQVDPYPRLFVLDERGTRVQATAENGAVLESSSELSKRVRWTQRTSRPRWVNFAPDLNGDGAAELVAPRGKKMEIWNRVSRTGSEAWAYDRAAAVDIEISRSHSTDFSLASSELGFWYSVPSLRWMDQNGDGRKDLWVSSGEKHYWHILGPNGEIPAEATRSVDLALYQDNSSSDGEVLGGEALTIQQTLSSQDLDQDGILDFAIARGRKVWLYPGTAQGPQFEKPSMILRSSQDISAMIFAPMDADKLPDLLLVRVIKPGVGTLIQGLVAEWEIQIDALAYSNLGKGQFSKDPAQRATILLRLPPILEVLRNADKLIARFVGALRNLRSPIEGDLDGDGKVDIALLFDDVPAAERRIELWLSSKGALNPDAMDQETLLRTLLFETEDKVWTVDRTLAWLGDLSQGLAKELHGNRKPDYVQPLADSDGWRMEAIQAADLDGDGRDELFVLRRSLTQAQQYGSMVFGLPKGS